MSRKAIFLTSSPRLKSLIKSQLTKRQIDMTFQRRLHAIHLALEGEENQSIHSTLNLNLKSVRLWRLRWFENIEYLSKLESGEIQGKVSDKVLLKAMEKILSDSPRSGSSSRITNSEKLRIQALACELPSVYGLPITVWTHETLSMIARTKLNIQVSSAHLGRILKKRITAA